MAMAKRARGGKELRAHEKGKRLTRQEAIMGKCYECMNSYADGIMDCLIPSCPLYPYFSYKGRPAPVERR